MAIERTGLIFIFVISLHGSMEYQENCDFRLDDLCRTWRQAAVCNTTPYCTHCVWNTGIVPNEDWFRCQMCKDGILKGIRNNEDVIPLLRATCKLHTNEIAILKCEEFVHTLPIGIIDDIVQGKLRSTELCALIALCRSLFEVIVTNLDEDEEIVPTVMGENSGPIARSGTFPVISGRRSIFGSRAKGIVIPIPRPSYYTRPTYGSFVPIFLMGEDGVRYKCKLQEEAEYSVLWKFFILVVIFGAVMAICFVCFRAIQIAPSSN